jgi:hypothetical protein
MVCGIVGGLAAVATLTFLDKFFGWGGTTWKA